MNTADFVIIGGGVMGLAMAREVRRCHPASRVVVLEKESACGQHASGRNSGVVHAGFYYTADSLKARFTREGNQQWRDYCQEHRLPLRCCGKLVVARHAGELAGLAELQRRGAANGVVLESLTAAEARRLEPRVKTCERALFSPATASLDPRAAMATLERQVRGMGVEIALESGFVRRQGRQVVTRRGVLEAGYVINAAGLYADRIAQAYGFAEEYTMLPFKGLYLYGNEGSAPPALHLYPVPDLANPFLGVHFTVTVQGGVKIGPTAVPAFWREHYQGWQRFRLEELATILATQWGLFWRNDFRFRQLALSELAKQSRRQMANLAGELLEGVTAADYRHWGAPGLRAQLFNRRSRTLEMDFRFQGDADSFHILNAVSPGFTCAFPFARFMMEKVTELTSGHP